MDVDVDVSPAYRTETPARRLSSDRVDDAVGRFLGAIPTTP